MASACLATTILYNTVFNYIKKVSFLIFFLFCCIQYNVLKVRSTVLMPVVFTRRVRSCFCVDNVFQDIKTLAAERQVLQFEIYQVCSKRTNDLPFIFLESLQETL